MAQKKENNTEFKTTEKKENKRKFKNYIQFYRCRI